MIDIRALSLFGATPSPLAATSPTPLLVALGYWKLAIILEGVYARYAAGQYGAEAAEGAKQFGRTVERLTEAAAEAERRLA